MGTATSSAPRHPALRWFQWMFFLAGSFALAYSGYVLLDAKIYQSYEDYRFQQALRNAPVPSKSSMTTREIPRLPAAEDSPPRHSIPESAAAPSPVDVSGALGRMEIKRVGLTAMILEGIDDHTLRRAIGHVPETALPGQRGNVAIAGHRETFFRELQEVRKDDEITITTLQGTYRYIVDFSEIVEPGHVEALAPFNEPVLTLITCYPFYYVGPAPKRLIVRAHLVPWPQHS